MRSTLGGFFIESGHEGFDESQGSNRSRLPPGVRTMKVECPSHVMDSFCIVKFTNLRIVGFDCRIARWQSVHSHLRYEYAKSAQSRPNELLAIFNQSQLTARMNQAARRSTKNPQSGNRQ